MSDKSFGDHTNRNIVKNPLLSSAVTGLSLEDLTHKAVLLPVTPTLGQITRPDKEQGSQSRTLAESDHETHLYPSGDALSNITSSNITHNTNPNILDSQYNVKQEKNRVTQIVTQSKASAKSDDDFDVNEYIARLQGSRYVSAPLHSHHKEEQNVNLQGEENLEEINLNEVQNPVEVQQSLTADIAQNFSQLPAVLPHVASAVFSSFSNMLSYKSREQTPDHRNIPEHDQRSKGYEEVQFQRPDVVPPMGVQEYSAAKEVAPPPKEPPTGGTGNFRITTKKKYAQIPGLSSGDAGQAMTYHTQSQNTPFGLKMPPIGHDLPPQGPNIPPSAQTALIPVENVSHTEQPQIDQNVLQFSHHLPPTSHNYPPVGHHVTHMTQNMPHIAHVPPISRRMPPIVHDVPIFSSPSVGNTLVQDSAKPTGNEAVAVKTYEHTHSVIGSHSQYNILNPVAAESRSVTSNENTDGEGQPNSFDLTKDSQNFFAPIEYKAQETQNIPQTANVPGGAAIIPPPPMFSNLPRKDNQTGVGKSILPPSVARRISANQPIIKPAGSIPSFSENIFVPAPVSEDATQGSGEVENISSKTVTSAFVAGQPVPLKPDLIEAPPTNIRPPSQIEIPHRLPPMLPQGSDPAVFFIPSNEEKSQTSTDVQMFFSPKDIGPVASSSKAIPNEITPTPPFPSAASNSIIASNSVSIKPPPVYSIFNPAPNIATPTYSSASSSAFQSTPQSIQTTPAFLNPLQHTETVIQKSPHPITQMPPLANPEPPKPVVEPPKAPGNLNFRMTKKRPQYYAGPIEGVGAISNNIKPVIAPVIPSALSADTSNFQGALFTPEQPIQATDHYTAPNIEQSAVPFDINHPGENRMSTANFNTSEPIEQQLYSSPFDIGATEPQSYVHDYKTSFDLSRAVTDQYDPPKPESKGFGIIGSLKSKLSSIDINKIQNTVTTFFDPAYNENKSGGQVSQDNISYRHQQQHPERSEFDIFIPTVEHNQYSEVQNTGGYDRSPQYQYYQTPESYAQNQNLNVYSTSSYFTDPNYSTEQVHTANPLYDNTFANYQATEYTQQNVPQKIEKLGLQTSESKESTSFYNPNTYTQESITSQIAPQTFDISQVNNDTAAALFVENNPKSLFDLRTFDSKKDEKQDQLQPFSSLPEQATENITFYHPHAFAQETPQVPETRPSYFDLSQSFSQPLTDQKKNTVSDSSAEKSQEPTFYDPNAYEMENQHCPKAQTFSLFQSDIQTKTCTLRQDLTLDDSANISADQKQMPCDSALNTSKYSTANIQSSQQQNIQSKAPLVPASNFFDNPQIGNIPTFTTDVNISSETLGHSYSKSEDEQQEQFESKNEEIYKMLSDTPVPIGVKSTKKIDQIYYTDINKENLVKENNLMKSLSKPILGMSTVPLFDLSTLIADRSREISESENETRHIAPQSQNLFEANSGSSSFFESVTQENIPEIKSIDGNISKGIPLDITGLSITDVKNVLLIEPPQEDIGTLLQRNASSNKLENRSKAEVVSSDHYKRQNDNLPSTMFQEKLNLKFDETSEVFFKHSDTAEKDVHAKKIAKKIIVEHQEEDTSDLNICETCREVNSPDIPGQEHKHQEIEDLTTQMIENITSPMNLSNPLKVPLPESDVPVEERSRFDDQQFEEITHIAEDTIETLQVQSAIELLDDEITTSEVRNYGWTTEDAAYSVAPHVDRHDYGFKVDSKAAEANENDKNIQIGDDTGLVTAGNNYEFKIEPDSIGFTSSNSLFFGNLPKNASDEIKAEIKHSHEDIVLPRQMSIPSAPPAEDDTKSDETGSIDVHSIEQDAKNDFPIEEEFIIEPSETDDDKIEFRERKKSSEDSTVTDTFTNRVEKFKKAIDIDEAFEQIDVIMFGSPPMSMTSYFDTGNYAVESHYRNSLTSPTSIKNFQHSNNTMRIPPGFEEEYARRLSGMSLTSGENQNEPYIPDTSTQTRTTVAITFSSTQDIKENVIGSEMRRKENIEAFSEIFTGKKSDTNKPTATVPEPVQGISNPIISDPLPTLPLLTDSIAQLEITPQKVQPLQDPINFFSANVEEPKTTQQAPEGFNRLASYFSMPPAQPEHSKSFFELSQSQNHYRHEREDVNIKTQKPFFELSQSQNHYMDDMAKQNITDLMKDLTSPQNLQEQIVRTVNYFTVELNNDVRRNTSAAPINVKALDENKIPNDFKLECNENKNTTILVENDCKDLEDVIDCKYCLNNLPGINAKGFKVRTANNDNSVTTTETETMCERDNASSGNRTVTAVNFGSADAEGEAQERITILNENRTTSEYIPVKHHWFYRVDVEEKSVWRGFSLTDSRALEDAFHSPELNEGTLIATDGGRFDVNVLGRLRSAVYWKEKPTNVRRCSWFYKGTTDPRYVPYTEAVAEKLEEEYRHGVTTGEWHRRLSLPNNEMVIMHGPSVMVHFLHSGATDAFSTPPSLLGKRVYRNPPKIHVQRDEPQAIDHLIFLVHGAGEHKVYLKQTTTRPRVVRRGYEESEIEDCEPSSIDHLLLLCHGVGSACDMRFRSVEEVVEDFRTTSLQLLQSHYRNSYDNGIVSRVEVLPISWHAQLHSGETGVDHRLSRVTLDSIPRLRAFTNHTVLDVLFYTSPVFHQTIIDTVCSEMNRIYNMFKQRNPSFKGDVSLGGHSLGSVILYDLLCHQMPESPEGNGHQKSGKSYVAGTTGTELPSVKYPQLGFPPAALYALGSPIAIFECIRGVESLGMDFALPTCKKFFNIFHPYDPIAYRIEPLINPMLQDVKPSQIPHHKGRKRMHLELKDTMYRVGTDLKQKLIESLRTTWNKWKASPPTDGQLEKVVEEEMEKEQLSDESKEDQAAEVQVGPEALGALNGGRRVDYVLQEAPLEMINEYLFAMTSHVGYWESEDTMLLMLREIYSSLGVQPDSTVPQQSMTVHRTRTLGQEETVVINHKDYPSTSRGST